MVERVWLAIGSNQDDPLQQVKAALLAISKLPKTRLLACSSFYRSRPLGPQDQPDFLNAVASLDTILKPITLLDYIQTIELEQGRVRKKHRFGPRTIDLDILLFGKQIIKTPRLTVPHYDMQNREFMLRPLSELAPDLIFPNGVSLSELIRQMQGNSLTYWDKKHRYQHGKVGGY